MMNKRKLFSVLLVVCLAFALSVTAFASNSLDPVSGTTTFVAIDPTEDPGIEPYSSTGSFSGTLDGNEYVNYEMVLHGDYRYWRLRVDNTGDYDISVDANGDVYPVKAHSSGYIYSTSKWSAGTYTIGFSTKTIGQPMSGSVQCTLYTTLEEATP